VAFGSNLGDRRGHVLQAAREVARILSDFGLSTLIETAPVGAGLEHDPPFLNAVGMGASAAPLSEIFAALSAIEARGGRTRPHPGAPRTIDIDLILAGQEIVNEAALRVPHPRFRDRLFVLEPLVEIAPEMCDPITGLTIAELLKRKKAGACAPASSIAAGPEDPTRDAATIPWCRSSSDCRVRRRSRL
jgi:2-amino-4-hydroxy-6-hydroxymethyldihydropteridine diphosphokinase